MNRYSPAFEQGPVVKADEVPGRNFFTEVVPAEAVKLSTSLAEVFTGRFARAMAKRRLNA